MDSLLNYIGHKSKIVVQIKTYLPSKITGTFYDCFAGSGVVALSVDYAKIAAVEINPYLSGLYRDLSDSSFFSTLTDMINLYGLTNSSVTPRSEYLKDPNIGTVQWMGETISNLHLDQLNKSGYTQLLRDFNDGKFTGIQQSAAYMIATIYGRNSQVATDLTTGKLSGSVGPLDYSRRCHQKLLEHQHVLAEGRHEFITGSYRDIEPGPDDFCYFDPPYLASGFRYSGWTDRDERDLLEWIDRLPCPWAVSNTLQSGNRINNILAEWSQNKTIVDIDKRYRKWASSGNKTVDRQIKNQSRNIDIELPIIASSVRSHW
jgi:site-specific DNA-adenine methylase